MDVSPDRLPARIDKPWGYEIWYAWTDRYVGKILHVRPGSGCRCSTTARRTRRATCCAAGCS